MAMLREAFIDVEELAQTQNNLSTATQCLYDHLVNRKIRIYPSEDLRAHVLNAAFTGSWALCADGLRHPHLTEIVRPIVFDAALAAGRDDVVLCHLNHRLVQMCLRLLRAEIWSQGQSRKLHRFTSRMVPDNVLQNPAVIVHGRLLVCGRKSYRADGCLGCEFAHKSPNVKTKIVHWVSIDLSH